MKKERLLNAIGQIDDRLISGADPQVHMHRKKIRRQWIAALAACLVLVIGIGTITPIVLGNQEAGKVTMEINPGVEYTITRNGNVKSVRFLNDDAKEVLSEASLKGESLENAISITLAIYKISGYMERNDTVLISFDRQLSENGKLREAVAEDVRSVLEKETSVHTLVYVSESDNSDDAALAKKYSISQGKAKLVSDAAKNSNLSTEALVKLPLDELVGLQKEVDSVVIDTKYIGMLKAKAIALDDAGCATRVTFTEAILIDEGIKYPYYRLVFRDNYTQWTYSINAINGDIIAKNEVALFISLEEARAIALADAEISGSEKVVFTKEELNRNQGRPCWVLEFYTAKYQYSYKVDAKTGEIIYNRRYIYMEIAKETALKDSGCSDVGKVVFTAEELVDGGIKTPYYQFVFNDGRTQWTYRINAVSGGILDKKEKSLFIPLQKAKEIALADAEISGSEKVVFTKEELSRNQGRPCWVLEFYTAKYQYSYKVDAKTGEIIYNRRYIYVEIAKETALKDSGCSDVGKVVFTAEELVDGGIKTPYYQFIFNDGRTQWTYRIDAVLGGILNKQEEPLFIPLQKAKEIALADAEISGSEKVVFTKEELSRNQGRPCWVLEFHTAKYQYSYKVDAKTGEIIYNRRYIHIDVARKTALEDSGCSDASKVVFTAEELVDGGIKTPYYQFVFNDGRTQWTYRIDAVLGGILSKSEEPLFIPLQKAKEIALADAEISGSEKVVFTKEELSRNQGRPCWVLEFYTAKYQYSYKIDAKTGEIIYNRRYIYMEIARETALKDSGCSEVGKVVFTAEELVDGGIKTPYYQFIFNDGRT